MEKVRFGKTGLMVSKVAMGGIPIQRLTVPEAVEVVRGVLALGVNFIDTANGYTDSEEKIGLAIKDLPRESIIIASKSGARDKATFLKNLDTTLSRLGVEYVDIYQHHGIGPDTYDTIFGEGGAYEGMLEGVQAGKIRFPAFSSHDIPVAMRIMREGKFAAVQLPFNYVDDTAAEEAIPLAKELDMGFIAMKPFGGGLLSNARLSIKYLCQFENIVPDPGIEKLSEMEEIVGLLLEDKAITAEDLAEIARVKAELGDVWCHRCNYCQPCPQGIPISSVLTVESSMRRFPLHQAIAMGGRSVEAAKSCVECRECVDRCPYHLNIPELMKEKSAIWETFIAAQA
jgi:predicted aldo/keto reductase-like oxidoreductase